jgi:hypothetical protein
LSAIRLLLACSLGLCGNVASAKVVRGVILENGEPVAARLYIESKDGKWYHAVAAGEADTAVRYRVDRGKSKEIHTSLPAAEFTTDLPPGNYTFTVRRGKEYREVSQPVVVPAGDAAAPAIKISIKRWVHMAEKGWYSGDTHVHRSIADTRGALLAEDLNVAFPLTYWVTAAHESPTKAAKSVKSPPGNQPQEVAPGHLIYPLNTEYELFTYGGKRHTLGAVFVIGHQKPLELAAPLTAPIAAEARKQNALLDLDKHSWPWSAMIVPIMKVDLFELANNHVWRTEFLFRDWTIDTLPADWDIETDDKGGWTEHGWIDFGFKTYYAFLNCGFDIKPTGGTATGVHPVPLGFGRVYVEVDGEFTYQKWFNGLKQGRSFVTTGPMLLAKFDNKSPGSKVEVAASGDVQCKVTGVALSEFPIGRLEILVNGDVIKTLMFERQLRDPNGGFRVEFDETVSFNESSWVAVRCFQPRENGRYFYAHTAPVHYQFGKRSLRPKIREVRYLLQRVQEEITRNQGVITDEEMAEFRKAESIYKKLLERAK